MDPAAGGPGGRWSTTLLIGVLWCGLIAWEAVSGTLRVAAVYTGMAAIMLAWVCPVRPAGPTHADALADPTQVTIYWRPGCIVCTRLRWRLGARGRRARWVNVWQDPAVAAFVRAANNGFETVPVAVIGGRAVTNPEPRDVADALDRPGGGVGSP